MKKTKTIVCDVDDTISTHYNRDYENAIPHTAIINKLNALYDAGWEIIYQTARGQLSFDGDMYMIELHRRPVLEAWMKKHGVKYTRLTFQKELAQYYIDDKAIHPDVFVDMPMETLHGGSGAEVRREGNRVIKTQPNAVAVADWYIKADSMNVKVPVVHSIIGDTLTMDYIEPRGNIGTPALGYILQYVERFSEVPAYAPFETYIARVDDHLKLCNHPRRDDLLKRLFDIEDDMNKHKSFCHGDLTLGNCIRAGQPGEVYLIDPNPVSNVWSSYLLDYAKLAQSIQWQYENMFFDLPKTHLTMDDLYIRMHSSIRKYIPILQATHWVRMLKYKDKQHHATINDIIDKLLAE